MNTLINQLLAIVRTTPSSNWLSTVALVALPVIGSAMYVKKKKKKMSKFKAWLIKQHVKLFTKLGWKTKSSSSTSGYLIITILAIVFLIILFIWVDKKISS